jgi:hypothetical protein
MGNPLGNPHRGVSEMRRGEAVFVLDDLESGAAAPRHAMACAMPSHPEGHRRSMKSASCIPSRKGHKRKFRTIDFFFLLIIYFFANSFFCPCLIPYRAVASFPTWTGTLTGETLSYTSPLLVLQYVLFPFPQLCFSFMAVISLSTPLPFLPRHTMNLPSLPSEVLTLTASYPSWQPFHTITPPWSSKPHHPTMTMTTLPPITSLQRQHHYRDTARSSRLSISPSFHHSTSI